MGVAGEREKKDGYRNPELIGQKNIATKRLLMRRRERDDEE